VRSIAAAAGDPLRSRPLAEIERLLLESADTFGVARVGSITRLDAIGIAIATAIRRDPLGVSVSVCGGRGDNELEARVGALGEALERFAAEPRGRSESVIARYGGLGRPCIDPRLLVPARWADLSGPIEWYEGRGLDDCELWVPASAVLFPYDPGDSAIRLFAAHTHGLAVGATSQEAIAHALLECIERDAYSRALALASIGRGSAVPVIDPLAVAANQRVRRVLAAGLSLMLRDLTADTGCPVILATIADRGEVHLGLAAHPWAEQALSTAVAEAAQSRLTDIQGAREDLEDKELHARADPWFLERGEADLVALPGPLDVATAAETVAELTARLQALGLPAPIVVDRSVEGVDLSVVRVVAPELETWAFDPERVGRRAREWLSPKG
jgi:YcaO-like protein with predicted kinase domain